jgi:hypothetical protein
MERGAGCDLGLAICVELTYRGGERDGEVAIVLVSEEHHKEPRASQDKPRWSGKGGSLRGRGGHCLGLPARLG